MTKQKARDKCLSGPERIRPQINTYDSGYEHSVEHWVEVRRLVTKETGDARQEVSARQSKWAEAV
jgi:hypothetical protein